MPSNAELQEQAKEARKARDEWQKKYNELAAERDSQDQSDKPLNIHQKIIKVRSEVEMVTKDGEGQAGQRNFTYASTNALLKLIKEKMDELGVLLYPELPNGLQHELQTIGNRTVFVVDGVVNYVWQNADDPRDKLVIPWYVKGQQGEISQAFGSGMTYAERYFIFKFLNIPTDEDDPDNQANHQQKGQKNNQQGQKNGQANRNQSGGGGNQQKTNVAKIMENVDKLANLAGTTQQYVQNRLAKEFQYDAKTRFKQMDNDLQAKIVGKLKTWIAEKEKEGSGN